MSERNLWPIFVLTFLLNGGLYHGMSFLGLFFRRLFSPVIDAVEPFYDWRCIFPLVDLRGCYNFLVNFVENLLTYFADFWFSRVNQSTSGLVCKVRFMVLQGYKCLLLCRDVYPVVDAKFYCDFLIILLDLLCCIVVSFLVRFCDVLFEEFEHFLRRMRWKAHFFLHPD